jgi:thiamine biosynthesis lipoprotein
MKSALSEVRRARPLLGTFVEITAQGTEEARLHAAIDKAFAAVCAVHRLMNFHDPGSDVSRLNSGAARKPLRVNPWTRRVLLAARNFSRETGGAFDITAGASGSDTGFLSESSAGRFRGNWRDIIFGPEDRVHFRRPLLIDLGGIAKGFAVDRATEALIGAGATGGVVNAGGDLRAFGPKAHIVNIRHPLDPGLRARTISVRDGSIATSIARNSRPDFANQQPCFDGRTRTPLLHNIGATVCAPDCMTADALTKIALTMRHEARPILRKHQARAFLFIGESALCEIWDGHETKRHQA